MVTLLAGCVVGKCTVHRKQRAIVLSWAGEALWRMANLVASITAA